MKCGNLKCIAASIAIFLVLLIISGELITRVFGTAVNEYDNTLGWRPKKSFSKKIQVIDKSGEKYFVNYLTNEFGFREFGDLSNNKKRILFVGDSWTGDPNTSNEDAYFGIVKNNLPVEVFVIGAGGYGTLQELLLIKEYAGMIKPDIFVLQYCDNDIINNSFFLEGPSIARGQKNLRPYWVNNRIEYRLPSDSLYIFLYKTSKLFRTLDGLLSSVQYKIYKGYYPPQYKAYEAYGDFTKGLPPELAAQIIAQKSNAISVTQSLMSEMRRILPPNTKLITFSVSTDDPEELRIWQSISRNAGFIAYPSVSMRVEEAEKNGETVRVHDGAHWNRLGNKIAGEELVRIIRRDFLLP
ncbi:MAG: SGNH/GDSL hydrolase family protein [Nitrospirae bacterium]|nr:SGNH/GDSL hydrolase family protein [Nitrospirota bacterium]